MRRGEALLLLAMGALSAAEPPGKVEVIAPHGPGNPRNSEGDVVELPGGALLLAWSEFYGGPEDEAAARIAARLSLDGGKTWRPRFVLQENTGRRNVMSVSLLRRRSGEVLLVFLRKDSASALAPWMRRRGDGPPGSGASPEEAEAARWSVAEPIPVEPGYHVVNNDRVIETSRGRLLVPSAHTSDIGKDYAGQRILVHLSDDGGRTWTRSEEPLAVPGSPAMEPGLVELEDGSLLMIIRTRLGRIWASRSADGGKRWEKPAPTALSSPASPASVARLPGDGRLLLVWNDHPGAPTGANRPRTPLSAALSADGGRTWSAPRVLESDPGAGFAYTSITFIGERALLTYYREKGPRFEATELILREVDLAWLRS